jgi:predicted branched-subunit amino acid permease
MSLEGVIQTIIMAGTILVAGSFSLWYSLYLSLKRKVSFKYPFYITLISYIVIGLTRGLFKIALPDFKGLTVILISVLVGLLFETYLVRQVYNLSTTLAFITTFIAFIVSIIIVVPLIVSAGFVLSYITAPASSGVSH